MTLKGALIIKWLGEIEEENSTIKQQLALEALYFLSQSTASSHFLLFNDLKKGAIWVYLKFINPLYTNGFLFLVWCNELGIVHCTYLGVSGYKFQNILMFFVWRHFLTLTNSVDPDEMQHNAAFHLGLHCLRKYLFRGFPVLVQIFNYTNLYFQESIIWWNVRHGYMEIT